MNSQNAVNSSGSSLMSKQKNGLRRIYSQKLFRRLLPIFVLLGIPTAAFIISSVNASQKAVDSTSNVKSPSYAATSSSTTNSGQSSPGDAESSNIDPSNSADLSSSSSSSSSSSGGSSTNVSVTSNTTQTAQGSGGNSNTTTTDLTINGRPVSVPANTSYETNAGGSTVTVSNQTNSDSTTTQTNVQTNSGDQNE